MGLATVILHWDLSNCAQPASSEVFSFSFDSVAQHDVCNAPFADGLGKLPKIDVSCTDKALDLCANTVHNETGDMAMPLYELTLKLGRD
jgi:hypothetical protein